MHTTSSTRIPKTEERTGQGGLFVLHRVEGRLPTDWLLGLDVDDRFITWSLGHKLPSRLHEPRLIRQLPDRPHSAGWYEGRDPLGRANVDEVTIVDRGTHEIVHWNDEELRVRLFGAVARGEYRLRQLDGDRWEVSCVGDVENSWRPLEPRSVMQVEERPVGDGVNWAYEPRWTGLRCWYELDDDRTRVLDAQQVDRADNFGELRELGASIGAEQLLLDGVVLVFDADRRPDAAALSDRMDGNAAGKPVVFVAFDIVHLDGQPLWDFPLDHRRKMLEGLKLDGPHWVTTPQWTRTTLRAALEAARSQGLHGVVAKRRGSPYDAERSDGAWRFIPG